MSPRSIVPEFLPSADSNEVSRDGLLTALEREYSKGAEVIWFEGQDGSGRTQCLRQFALRHSDNAVVLFISHQGRWTADWEMIRWDFCDQIGHLCEQIRLPEGSQLNDGDMRSQMMRLIRFCRRRSDPLYFIIDGLENIPSEQAFVREQLFNALPLRVPNCKFLISCNEEPANDWFKTDNQKSFPAIPFNTTETQFFLGDTLRAKDQLHEIQTISKGHPGHLAAIRRIFEEKTAAQQKEIISRLPDEMPRLFDIEWDNMKCEKPWRDQALAIIAFERRVAKADLASYLDVSVSELSALSKIRFLGESKETEFVSYISDSFRSYAEKRLEGLRREVTDIIIRNLMRRPDEEVAFSTLPGYFVASHRNEELLAYLSPSRVQEILARHQSCSSVIKKTAMGIKSASQLKQDGELLRLSSLKAALVELERLDTWRAEVEAYVALEQYDRALVLAGSCRLREHRLRMMAVIGHKLSEQKKEVPPELVTQIRALYATVDLTSLKDVELELASDLISVTPEIAIELVEKSSPAGESEAKDLAYAQLSILAGFGKLPPPETGKPTLAQSIREKIQNVSIRTISEAAQLLVGGYSVEKVLAEIGRLNSAKEQLFLLQHWLKFNRTNDSAWRVSEFGIGVAIKTSELTPNASILADLAAPLANCADHLARTRLVATFDAQKAFAEKVGPSGEYVRLQLYLSSAEMLHDETSAVQRVLDTFFFAGALGDPSTKLICFAHLQKHLVSLRDLPEIQKEGVEDVLEKEIDSGFSALLAGTADHYLAVAPLLKRIASYDSSKAYRFAQRLNLPSRCHRASRDVALAALKSESQGFRVTWQSVANDLGEESAWDNFVLGSLAILARKETFNVELEAILARLESGVQSVSDSEKRCNACCQLLKIQQQRGVLGHRRDAIAKLLKDSWESIDQTWLRAEMGFRIGALAGPIDKPMAELFVRQAEEIKNGPGFFNSETVETFLVCLMLAVRAFGGLIRTSASLDADLEKLSALISRIPSNGDQVKMWSEVALRCFMAKRRDIGERVVREKIKPCIAAIADTDNLFKWSVIEEASAALYAAHAPSAMELLASIPEFVRSKALNSIATFIWRRNMPNEPFDDSADIVPTLTWEEVLDLCVIADHATDDWTIYRLVNMVADVLASRHGKSAFNANQRNDLHARLTKLVAANIPTKHFTVHEGYRIICDAQISRLLDDRGALSGLIARTKNLPNVADRAYIFTILASVAKEGSVAADCARLAREATSQIAVDIDRIEHYMTIVKEIDGIPASMRAECLKTALEESFKSDEAGAESVRRRVLDLLHTHEPEKRNGLTTFLDDDPARKEKKLLIESKLRELDVRKQLADVDSLPEDEQIGEQHTQAAWRLLGRLHAGRVAYIASDKMRQVVAASSKLPLKQAYPMLAWAVENQVRKFRDTSSAQLHIRPLFDAALTTAQIACWLGNTAGRAPETAMSPSYTERESLFLGAGNQTEASRYIEEWLRTDCGEHYIICDPYFTHEELKILMLFKSNMPSCRVDILTSRKGQKPDGINGSFEEQYRFWWKAKVSDDEPCETRVIVAGFRKDGSSPIHDRWILGKSSGLRLGASLNGMGVFRLSEISKIDSEAFSQCREKLKAYIEGRVRIDGGERIDYLVFSL